MVRSNWMINLWIQSAHDYLLSLKKWRDANLWVLLSISMRLSDIKDALIFTYFLEFFRNLIEILLCLRNLLSHKCVRCSRLAVAVFVFMSLAELE